MFLVCCWMWCGFVFLFFFFFNQKTAYEFRISDWSSDVCSSDLIGQPDLLDIAFVSAAGAAIFDNLGLLFAIGVAVGFARDGNGAAALAGVTCYLVTTNGAQTFLTVPPDVGAGLPEPVAALAMKNWAVGLRSEEHTSELQSLMRISYAVFCLKKKKEKHETMTIEYPKRQ